MAKSSVPSRFIGRQVRVSLRASELVVFDGRAVIAQHRRVVARGADSIDLDHYLEVLQIKPGALPGSTALARARTEGVFTAAREAFWAATRRVNGDAAGTRQLIDVLLHRSMPAADVIAGLVAAVSIGAVTADVVAVEARRHHAKLTAGASSDRHLPTQPPMIEHRVVSLMTTTAPTHVPRFVAAAG